MAKQNGSPRKSQPKIADERRAQLMCQMRAEGLSLDEIGIRFGVCRERVRQVIKAAGGPDKNAAKVGRQANAERKRLQLRGRAIALCQRMPGLTIDEAAADLGATVAQVRAALGDDAGLLLVRRATSTDLAYSDEELLGHVRRAAQSHEGPLTASAYDSARDRFGGASLPSLINRFGTWRAACAAAGVVSGEPFHNGYRRRWDADAIIDIAVEYLTSPGAKGTFEDYCRWAKAMGHAPSGATMRNRAGAWGDVKGRALVRIARLNGGRSFRDLMGGTQEGVVRPQDGSARAS